MRGGGTTSLSIQMLAFDLHISYSATEDICPVLYASLEAEMTLPVIIANAAPIIPAFVGNRNWVTTSTMTKAIKPMPTCFKAIRVGLSRFIEVTFLQTHRIRIAEGVSCNRMFGCQFSVFVSYFCTGASEPHTELFPSLTNTPMIPPRVPSRRIGETNNRSTRILYPFAMQCISHTANRLQATVGISKGQGFSFLK
jgi:hypothetical protein